MKYYVFVRNDEKSLSLSYYIESRIDLEIDKENPDIVIAVGGDGTILQAFHKYPKAIIFGLHTGHLGFFANYTPNSVDELISVINSGDYHIDTIPLLTCKINTLNKEPLIVNALNEITIISILKTLILDVKVDDLYFETFRGTGLCISTSQGSTAYNKSLFGAVVDHKLSVIQLAEIASINSNAYRTLGAPLVLSDSRRINLLSNTPLSLNITVDHICYNFDDFVSCEFSYIGNTMRMGSSKPEGFIKRVARTFINS